MFKHIPRLSTVPLSFGFLTLWAIVIFNFTFYGSYEAIAFGRALHILLTIELAYLCYCLYDRSGRQAPQFWVGFTVMLIGLSVVYVFDFWLGILSGFVLIFIFVISSKNNRQAFGEPLVGTRIQDFRNVQDKLDRGE